MALRVAAASAAVSRKAGRRRHRLGAFRLVPAESGRAYPDSMRRLLLLVSTIVFVDAMLFTALTPLVPKYAAEFDLSKLGAGMLVGAFGAGAILGGVPGGLIAARFGPKRAVLGGLLLLAAASFAHAAANRAVGVGAARFVPGLSSTTTWAGALAWLAVETPVRRRGEVIGIAFGAAIFGAVLGPMLGGLAELVGTRPSFAAVGIVALACTAVAWLARPAPPEPPGTGEVSRAFRDPRFLGGLWLNTLPAFLFGVLVVLGPLAFAAGGWSTIGIAIVFFVAGLAEIVVNPVLGRVSDRVGRLLPIRLALVGSIVVALGLAVSEEPLVLALLVCAAAVSFGGFYTPGMALASHRADVVGLAQGLAFGLMNTAWALGEMTGPTIGGGLAEAFGDPVPYLVGAALCALTLVASLRVAQAGRARPRAA